MNIRQSIRDLERLEIAVENFKELVGTCQTFGPEALPEHMNCSEANVFAELLAALGMPEEASSVRVWHSDEHDDVEKTANHPDWS